MKWALVISANNFYRHLGPLGCEAVKDGIQVTFLHHVPENADKKQYRIPAITDVPESMRGHVEILEFVDNEELRTLVEKFDAVFGLHGPGWYFDGEPKISVPWYIIQHGKDSFHLDPEKNLMSADRFFVYSKNWLDWYREVLEVEQHPRVEQIYRSLQDSSMEVGVVEHDAISKIDKAEVHRQLGLDPERPVITYLPNSPCGHQECSLWCKYIYQANSRWEQLTGWVKHLGLERKYFEDILHGCSDRVMVESIRRFADRNNAQMLIKTRPKTPLKDYEKMVADAVDMDGTHCPARFLEVASISKMIIGYYSTSVLGAAALGVPYLQIRLRYPEEVAESEWLIQGVIKRSSYISLWEREGYPYSMEWKEWLKKGSHQCLEAYAPVKGALESYRREHLGFSDQQASRRIINIVKQEAGLPA